MKTKNETRARCRALAQAKLERRVLAYIKTVIRRSPDGCCDVPQEVIRKAMKCGRNRLKKVLNTWVERCELVRVELENRNRINKRYIYFLPESDCAAGSIEAPKKDSSSLSSTLSTQPNDNRENEWDITNFATWNGLNRLELIEAYIDAGLEITPLVEGNKIPPEGWTREKLGDTSKNSILDFFANNPRLNVGTWLPENILVVDVDDAEAFYGITGGEDFATMRVSNSGRGFHLYFWNDKHIGGRVDPKKLMDFKARGGLVVLPPSVHKSGRVYEWAELVEPIETPRVLKEYYDAARNELPVIMTSPVKGSKKMSVLSKTEVIREGFRYPSLFRLGRRIRWGLNTDELARELREYNRACCRPPLDERRMNKLIRDVVHGKDGIDWLSRKTIVIDGARG